MGKGSGSCDERAPMLADSSERTVTLVPQGGGVYALKDSAVIVTKGATGDWGIGMIGSIPNTVAKETRQWMKDNSIFLLRVPQLSLVRTVFQMTPPPPRYVFHSKAVTYVVDKQRYHFYHTDEEGKYWLSKPSATVYKTSDGYTVPSRDIIAATLREVAQQLHQQNVHPLQAK